jgi:hypothetical protein
VIDADREGTHGAGNAVHRPRDGLSVAPAPDPLAGRTAAISTGRQQSHVGLGDIDPVREGAVFERGVSLLSARPRAPAPDAGRRQRAAVVPPQRQGGDPRGQAVDPPRQRPGGAISVAELPVGGLPPAPGRPLGERAAVSRPQRHGRRAPLDPFDPSRWGAAGLHGTGLPAAVLRRNSRLAGFVASPAPDGALRHRAAVLGARRERRHGSGKGRHETGGEQEERPLHAALPSRVVTPAVRLRVHDRAGVGATGRQRGRGSRQTPHAHGQRSAADHLPVPELARPARAPALHLAGDDRAGVGEAREGNAPAGLERRHRAAFGAGRRRPAADAGQRQQHGPERRREAAERGCGRREPHSSPRAADASSSR